MQKCLLIVDAQEAWRDKKSSFYIGGLTKYIAATNKLLDWAHQSKIPVIFSLHVFRKDGSDILTQEKGVMDDFLAGNLRAGLIADLKKASGDRIVVKNRFSVFSNKNFHKILEDLKIDEVFIGGITTNCCVRATIVDLYNLAYKITVIKEACAASSKKTDEFTFRDLKSLLYGIKIVGLDLMIK